ncbi:BlaI/MecI/CopY family transcriptional regulator [Aliikangiella sp. IMCC44359]|uniref:BlaI/MecI/CopY family transcriptional regulator n=1 Tax=Aliikangiella sp. IMCC44359 TaxID=3459125 RepID=UPI00403ACBEC
MQISDSEKYIMDILWQSSPQTAKAIIDQIDSALNWQDKTIKTLINRLLKKGAINYEKKGREYLYYPVLEEQVYIENMSESFLERVFKGNVGSLVAAFTKKEKLSAEDIKDLKVLIDDLENDKGTK